MLEDVWNFARRHQRKLVITAGIAGGLYYSGKLLAQRLVEMQATSSKERSSKENIRRRFDQNQRDCLFTIMSLLPELSEQVLREVDVERLISELRAIHKSPAPAPKISAISGTPTGENVWSNSASPAAASAEESGVVSGSHEEGAVKENGAAEADGASSAASTENEQESAGVEEEEEPIPAEPARRAKVEIWEDIKIQSFARTLIAVYSESLLTIIVHIQLNMVGRSTYLDSVIGKFAGADRDQVALEGRYTSRLSMADEQNFLMLSWWFLNRGWRQLMVQISGAVNQCIGGLSLKEKVSHRELAGLFNSIHNKLRENGLMQSLPGIILPLGDESIEDYLASNRLSADQVFSSVFARLLDQMRDVIESADFNFVFTSCIDRLTGEAAPNLDDVVKEFEEFSAPPESRVVIVQLLPRIAREVHQILNGVPNQYLENVSASREVQALSAAVYTAEDVL
ncbi:Peroxin-3 [Martensiomyces pterosporus]|nr:Peroxin-3 [Martensiomyces pterosporus]